MTGGPPRVLATVLTFGAPERLATCLAAVRAQTEAPAAVLVVDNAGEPPAAVDGAGAGPEITVLRTDENLGPAGGHASALRWFLAGDHDAVWILDDDMVPEPDCLARLRSAIADRPDAFALPTIHDLETGRDRRWPAWCGVLVPRAAVEVAGVPREDLFWWAEDTEYLQVRLPGAGYGAQWPEGARVTHHRGLEAERRPPWKLYYETRNSVYVRLRVKGQWRHPGRLLRTVARLGWAAASADDARWRRLGLWLRGLFDGLTGRLGRRVTAT